MAMRKFPVIGLILLLTIVGSPTTAEEPVCPRTPSHNLDRSFFPDGFLFGTATAAYQVEGAVNEGGRGKSLWDVYCKDHPERCNNENGDVADDFYHKYPEDIQLMKKLNTDAFRMSISWPRIFPNGKKKGGTSRDGVRYYHSVLDNLIANNITPFVTIFHWDTPQLLEKEYGGFLSYKIVKHFRDYAEFLFREYGDKVKYWITINEPWVYSHAGYDVGKKAPGRCTDSDYSWKGFKCLGGKSGVEAYQVTHNLLLAHAEAVQVFRECQKSRCKDAKIGIAHSPDWFEPYEDPGEKEVQRALDFMLGWHADPTTHGDYPETMKINVGERLPNFTAEQKQKLVNSTDFFGLNYYTSTFAMNYSDPVDKDKPRWKQDSRTAWEGTNKAGYKIGSTPKNAVEGMAVSSKGLRSLLKYIKKKYGDKEIMILENGYGEILPKDVKVEVGIADHNRKYYIYRHLFSMYQAICVDKVNVKGYFVWSLLDNFEWQDGYKVRFGLYHVDFTKKTLDRHEKVSGKFYREFLTRKTTQKDEL